MESTTLSGPLLYLLIAWGVVTAVFLVLLLRRSLLESHEDGARSRAHSIQHRLQREAGLTGA